MSADTVISIDQGTTSTRVVAYNSGGEVLASAQQEHQQFFPHPGWVEHDPVEIWNNTVELLAVCLTRTGLTPAEVRGVGITNQRETTVAWDRETGQPVYPAIVWQDTRTDEMMESLITAGHAPRVKALTGLPLASYFTASKLTWLLNNVDAAVNAAERGTLAVGTIDSWLLWNLTGGKHGGVHATDVTNASRTLLMNVHTCQWDPELPEFFELDADVLSSALPEIRPSVGHFGRISPRLPLPGVPVSGILGDQQAAAFGQAVFEPGEVKNTYGTGCFLLHHVGEEPVLSEHGLITTLAYQIDGEPPRYALEGSIAQAGSVVQWLRDNMGMIDHSADVESLAASVSDNGGVYFVPAFSGLFAPYWRSDARGSIYGLTGYATAGHIARAALEATAFQTLDVLDAVARDVGVMPTTLKVDGGMTVNDNLMQFQADILQIPVERPVDTETTALGAAYAAGLATGVWDNLEQIRALHQRDRCWTPQLSESKRHRLVAGWQHAIDHTVGWAPDQHQLR